MVLKKNIKEHKVVFEYGTITLYGIPFQGISFNQPLFNSPSENSAFTHTKMNKSGTPDDIPLQPPAIKAGFGLFPFRSPLLRE